MSASKRFVPLFAVAAGMLAAEAGATVVIEMQLNDAADKVALGDSVGFTTPVVDAAPYVTIQNRTGAGGSAGYYSAATGIDTTVWQSYLGTGYLQTPGGGTATFGFATPNSGTAPNNGRYNKYMGFSGFGTGTHATGDAIGQDRGGAVYMVFQPGAWGTTSTQMRGLFGSGYNIGASTSGGAVTLYGVAVDGTLRLRTHRGETSAPGHNNAIDFNTDGDNLDRAYAETVVTTTGWDSSKWYFVAASWKTGSAPSLYLRELAPDSTALIGSALAATNPQTNGTIDNMILATTPTGLEPGNQPFAFGALWYDPGSGAGPAYGLNGKIAYARVENVPVTTSQMADAYMALQVPEPAALGAAAIAAAGVLMRRRR